MQGFFKQCIACICAVTLSASFSGCDSNSSSSSSSSSSSGATSSSSGSGFVRDNVQVHFPPNVSHTNTNTLTVHGSIEDATDVAQVFVSDAAVTTGTDGTWSITVDINAGENTIPVTYQNTAGDTLPVTELTVVQEVDFISPKKMVLDEANNRFLVLDINHKALIAVDATTGERSIFSPAAGETNLLENPSLITLDAQGNQAIIYQSADTRFISVSLTDGSQTALLDTDLDGAALTDTITSISISSNNQLLVAGRQGFSPTEDSDNENITLEPDAEEPLFTFGVLYETSLTTGEKTIVSGYEVPGSENYLDNIVSVAHAPGSDKYYVVDIFTSTQGSSAFRLTTVDITDGTRERLLPVFNENNELDTTKFGITFTSKISLDITNNALWLMNQGKVTQLNLETLETETVFGTSLVEDDWSLFRSESTPADEPYILSNTSDFLMNSANTFAYTLSDVFDHLLQVDVSTGARTQVSGVANNNTTGLLNLNTPTNLTYDAVNHRVFVSDTLAQRIFELDLNTGERSVAAEVMADATGDVEADLTNPILAPLATTLGPEENTLYVLDNLNQLIGSAVYTYPRLYSVDVESPQELGTQTNLLSFNNSNAQLIDVTYSSANNAFYIADSAYIRKLLVTNSGIRQSVLSYNSNANLNHVFGSIRGLVFDAKNNRLLAADAGKDSIYTVNITTGTRDILSGISKPENSTFSFQQPSALVMDETNNRVLVLDNALKAIVAVDLDTGERNILVDISSTNFSLRSIKDMVYAPDLNYVLVSDSIQDGIFAIDLETQQAVRVAR